jgi:glycogen debranching enzyme
MERHGQNLPFQYHNGGIWPFVGAFWALLLIRQGRGDEALAEMERLAALNGINAWEFNEWFHGRTGVPGGMPGQSWNAALFLLAAAALENDLPLFG